MKDNNRMVSKSTMSANAEQLYKSHPNLKSAPSQNTNTTKEEPGAMAKQGSSYGANNKCAPDNNIFWEERGNHLSSKGDERLMKNEW